MKYVAVCKALYDYEAQEAEEVSIKEDDILYVVDNSDASWLEVQLKMPSVDQIGPIGLVPASYVEEVQAIGTVRAEYAYEAQQEEEVSFEEDEEMTLYDRDDADWYLVKVKSGEIGLAPSNYIKQTDDTHEEPQPMPPIPIAQPQQIALATSPSPIPSSGTPALNDEPKTWFVHEYNPEKKKRKKAKGTLTVGNSMISYESDSDKSAAIQQYHVLDISKYLLDTKNVHIEIISNQPIVFDFQAASKSEAKGILVKITDSRNAAAKHEDSQIPASPVRAASIDNEEPAPHSPNCEPKWGIVLYNFDADGGNELSVHEHDQVLITDYVSSSEWWHIELSDQRSGIVPSSYLQFHEDYEAALAKEERQLKESKESKRQKEAEQRRIDEDRQRQLEEQKRAEEDRRRAEEEQRRRQEEAARQTEEASRRQKQEEERKRQLEQKKQVERAAMYQDLPKPDPSKVRLWTDRTGAFKVEAQFVSASEGKYRLHKVNGVKIDVPEDKLCVEDVEYVRDLLDKEEQQKRKEKGAHESSKSATDPSKPTITTQNSYNQNWDWFDWFMMVGIPMQQSLVYSSAFKAEKLDDSDIPKLTHKQMKTLGLKEKYVQRIQRFVETEQVEPPSDDENTNENDEELVRRVQEAESEGKAPNIFRKKSKSSEGNATARPKATSPAPVKVHGDIFDLLTGDPIEEEPKSTSPKESDESAKQPTSPTSPQNGFDDDAWIPRTVQAIKTGTYKSKANTTVTPQNVSSGMASTAVEQQNQLLLNRLQQNGLQQAPVQAVNMSGQSQQYQPQPAVAVTVQQQPSGLQQPPVQAMNPTGQSASNYQQQSISLQQQQTGYQQYPNQSNFMAAQPTGIQQPISQVGQNQYVQQQLSGIPAQQQQMPVQAQFVPQQFTNAQFQQPTGIPLQSQFASQSVPNTQFQQQINTVQPQYVPQLPNVMQFQQQQPPSVYAQQPVQQPVQQNFVQPIHTATVPLSNILPAPLVPTSASFNSHQPQMTGQMYNGGMQPQSGFHGIQPQATGNRSWQTATAENPFGSPTPSPIVPQMTGVQFSTPNPDTFVGNHVSAIRPQYTGMSSQQSAFGNNYGGMFGQQNPAFQQAQAANNGFPQSNQYNRGW
ncbi:hypothetical protein BGW37DRAFT_223909 [Umbelopsis sp. PMI_123]|nr:hypothetical protein BGW37DRAFT_223909 [Umbelopsis sp. PMI_123]